ncbi:MAG: transporter substrate-binding domain-containing protein [Dongiaceae bacterium]
MGLAVSGAASEQSRVTILFHVRPPYAYYMTEQHVAGLLADRVSAVLAKANIAADWVEMPPARQTEEIKRATSPICGLGWFKRPEREEFATFTNPIYHDRKNVIIARKDDDHFTDGMSLQDGFRDNSRIMIVKTGYSYGVAIDTWIAQLHPMTETSSGDNAMLLGMIAQARADYAIMAPEEAADLLGTNKELGAALHEVRLSDAPDGERRYLMCSKTTPPELIQEINKALAR